MQRLVGAISLCFLVFAGGAAIASADSPAQRECEAAGGVYTFEKGRATCTFTEATNPGNPQSANAATPFEETNSETQPGQGGGGGETGDNNQNHEEVDGPVTNPSGNAPPGQN